MGKLRHDGEWYKNAAGVYVQGEPISAALVAAGPTNALPRVKADDTLELAALVAGANVTITHGAGTITIGASGGSGDALWVPLDPRTPAATPDADDDHFDDTGGMSGASNGLDSKWTWLNQETATATFANGWLLLNAPNSAAVDYRIIYQAVASTWKYRALLHVAAGRSNFHQCGIVVLDGTTSAANLMVFGQATTGALYSGAHLSKWTDVNTFSATTYEKASDDPTNCAPMWYEIEYDGTNLSFRLSGSGVEGSFMLIHSETAATFLGTPAAIGLASNADASGGATVLTCKAFVKAA